MNYIKYSTVMEALYLISRLKEHGLTQYRIAKRTGLSQATISRIISENRRGGLYTTIIKLQSLLTQVEAEKKQGKS